MKEIMNLYNINTDAVKTDMNVCAISIDMALKRYRKTNPIANIHEIKLVRSNVVV